MIQRIHLWWSCSLNVHLRLWGRRLEPSSNFPVSSPRFLFWYTIGPNFMQCDTPWIAPRVRQSLPVSVGLIGVQIGLRIDNRPNPPLWLLRFWRHLWVPSKTSVGRARYPSELKSLACRQDAWAGSRLPFAMDFFDLAVQRRRANFG